MGTQRLGATGDSGEYPDSYNVFYAGWSRAKVAPFNVTGIHHPSGDVKKISLYNGLTQAAAWNELPNHFHWMIPTWTKGITEPGSSGSPLFDNHGRVVGHLHGGQSSCQVQDGYDLYGALSADWDSASLKVNQIKGHLDPDNHRVLSMGGSYYTSSKKGPVGKELSGKTATCAHQVVFEPIGSAAQM